MLIREVKSAIKQTFVCDLVEKYQVSAWEKKGNPVPPPHRIKRQAVKDYAREFSLPILIETGTFLGDMIAAVKHDFQVIYSIEISQNLQEKAARKFANFDHIQFF